MADLAPAAALLCVALAGCNRLDAGLGAALDGGRDASAVAQGQDDAGTDAQRDTALHARDVGLGIATGAGAEGPTSLEGRAEVIGCADGSREAYLDLRVWPGIAGCSGAWQLPGLLAAHARSPQCERAAGNNGLESGGVGCSVADLCAERWHVCRDGDEVSRRSATECESAVVSGDPRFFLVRAAASPQGVCSAEPEAANDLHGCGTLGIPEAASCAPLERRLGFAECNATSGTWSCGGPGDHLNEANLVVKNAAELGGVLCCRD